MKIVRICPIYYPYLKYGGSVVADFTIDNLCRDHGIMVEVITCSIDCEKEVPVDRNIRYHRHFGSPIYGISITALFRILKNCISSKYSRRDEPTFWFGGVWNLLTLGGGLICAIFKCKYIISTHGMLAHDLIDMKSKKIKLLLLTFPLKFILKRAAHIHCTVDAEAKSVQEILKCNVKTTVVPLPVECEKYRVEDVKTKGTNPLVVSFIGRITKKKNVDVLIKAFNQATKHTQLDVKLHIIGPDLENLWDEIYSKLSLDEKANITYFGAVFGQELLEHFRNTNIFVLCSTNENYAISVLEAASACCALIIDDRVGVSQFFDAESAVLIQNTTVKKLSEALLSLIINDQKREQIAINGNEIAKKFGSSQYDISKIEWMLK